MDEEVTPTPPTEPATTGDGGVEEGKSWAAIAYLGILFLIPLLAKKDNDFAQYHARQGLVLFIAYVILSFVLMIPVLGWIASGIGYLLLFILFIIGLINALGGKKKPLPIIGQWGENMKI
jgi:uncharacterized membrane protein